MSGSGGLEAGDLLLTPPIIGEQKGVRLTAAPIVEGRALDAYVELYGAGRPEATKVTIEVADTDTSPVLTTVGRAGQRRPRQVDGWWPKRRCRSGCCRRGPTRRAP